MLRNMDREQYLKQNFNDFWTSVFKNKMNYYSFLTMTNLIDLKKAVSNINNIITLRTTLGFIDYLWKMRLISNVEMNQMKNSVLSTNVNSNGYDIDNCGIVAEIKCNIPVNTSSYGAAQEKSIKEDLDGLYKGKSTSKTDPKNCYKFMVLLDVDGVRTSMQKLVNKLSYKNIIEELNGNTMLSKDKIYIVYLKL
jgi:hypothetical protein